jgi:hypothetical protein
MLARACLAGDQRSRLKQINMHDIRSAMPWCLRVGAVRRIAIEPVAWLNAPAIHAVRRPFE